MKRLLSLLILLNSVACGAAEAPSAEQTKFFESKIRPLLVNNCMICHGAKTQKSGLRVDTLDALLKGGETGPALVRGDIEKSLLIKAITYKDEDLQMPPFEKLTKEGGKLADADIQTLTEWVKMGAPWPE